MKSSLKEMLSNILAYLLKCERKTLLWTNPNPTTGFAEQTLSMDLSNYDAIEVTICDYALEANRRNRVVTMRCPKGFATEIAVPFTENYTRFNNSSMRIVTPTNSGIKFSTGLNSTGTNIGNATPIKIYGIKMGGGTA